MKAYVLVTIDVSGELKSDIELWKTEDDCKKRMKEIKDSLIKNDSDLEVLYERENFINLGYEVDDYPSIERAWSIWYCEKVIQKY